MGVHIHESRQNRGVAVIRHRLARVCGLHIGRSSHVPDQSLLIHIDGAVLDHRRSIPGYQMFRTEYHTAASFL